MDDRKRIMKKVLVIIEKGIDNNYSAYMDDNNLPFGVIGEGKTVEEAKTDFFLALDEMKGYYKEVGKNFPANVKYEFKYDLSSFLQGYAYAFTLVGLERITKVNQGQLSHYINGVRNPSEKTVRKIENNIKAFGREISELSFIYK